MVKVAPLVHIVKLLLLFSFIAIRQHSTTRKNSCQPEGDLPGPTYPKISFVFVGVAIFNFLMEYVSGRTCMLSNEKCMSLSLTCTMHCCTGSWNHHHSSTRKGCQHVVMLLNIGSNDGQFPIETATYSLFLNWCLMAKILEWYYEIIILLTKYYLMVQHVKLWYKGYTVWYKGYTNW